MNSMTNYRRFSVMVAVITIAATNVGIAFAQNFWEPCNGKEYLVNVLSIVVDSKGTVFVSTVAGDVLRSTNEGASWAPVITGLPKGVVALDSDDVLYAGAESSDIYRSKDEGDSWDDVSSGLHGACSFAVDKQNVLYVGNDAGLWHSTDKGDHWSGGWAPGLPQGPTIQTIGIGPGGILFVATVADDDVYRSTNGGTSWSRASTNLQGNFPNAFVFNSSGVLLAGTDGGIYQTVDSGKHWVLADSGAWPARGFVFNAAGTLFAAAGIINYSGEGVIRSTDGGKTWSHARTGMTNNNGFAIAIDRNGALYCGTSSGVFRSSDNGVSWSGGITGLVPPDQSVLAINNEGVIFAGGAVADSGLYRSTDNGNSWNRLSEFPSSGCNALLVVGDSTIYAGIGGGAWSSDNGTTWTVMDTSLSNQAISSFCLATDGTLYAIADPIAGGYVSKYLGAIRSTDNGASWTNLKKGLPKYPPSTLLITKSGTLLANVFNDKVYRSTDKGDSWFASKGIMTDYFSTMAESPNGTIILGAMYASTDDGQTWARTGFNDPGDEVFAINADGTIYAHNENDTTVFSTDNGQTWAKAGSGLGSSSAVFALAFAPNGQLFTATNGRVFRSVKSTLTNAGVVRTNVNSDASAPTLGPNYPNPFGTSTMLTFSIPRTEFVSLRIYDITSREVGTILNEVLPQGSYQSSFLIGSLPDAIYLARLETEDGSAMRLLTLKR